MELPRVHSELTNHIHVCILFRVDNTLPYTLSVFPNLQTRNAGDLFHAKETGSTSCLWTIPFRCTPGLWQRWPLCLGRSSSSHTTLSLTSARSLHTCPLLKRFKEGLTPKTVSQPLSPSIASFFFSFFFRTYRNWIPYISTSLFAYSPFVSLQCKPQEGTKLGWFTGRYKELCEWKKCCLLYQ